MSAARWCWTTRPRSRPSSTARAGRCCRGCCRGSREEESHHRDTETQRRQRQREDRRPFLKQGLLSSRLLVFSVSLCLCGEILLHSPSGAVANTHSSTGRPSTRCCCTK